MLLPYVVPFCWKQIGASIELNVSIQVVNMVLPPPAKWVYHLDLWQYPALVGNHYGVKQWSKEHFRLLEPHYRMLADSGQKVITVYVSKFLGQPPMVKWIKKGGDSWEYDFSVMDRYVELMMSLGIDRQISFFSPLKAAVLCYSGSSGTPTELTPSPGSAEYRELWGPFLKALDAHLRRKGWRDRAVLYMDECKMSDVSAFIKLAKESVPGFKLGMAANKEYSGVDSHIYDLSVYLTNMKAVTMRKRPKRNQLTTFYVCCYPPAPNTFIRSQPAEAVWLSWHVASMRYSGQLRWAYDRWFGDDLLNNPGKHAGGDYYFVYRDNMSSIRLERLREGIQDFEKIRILRASSLSGERQNRMKELAQHLNRFKIGKRTYKTVQKTYWADTVNKGKALIDRTSTGGT